MRLLQIVVFVVALPVIVAIGVGKAMQDHNLKRLAQDNKAKMELVANHPSVKK